MRNSPRASRAAPASPWPARPPPAYSRSTRAGRRGSKLGGQGPPGRELRKASEHPLEWGGVKVDRAGRRECWALSQGRSTASSPGQRGTNSRGGEGWLPRGSLGRHACSGLCFQEPKSFKRIWEGVAEVDLEHLVSAARAGRGAAAGMPTTVRPCFARGWASGHLGSPGSRRCASVRKTPGRWAQLHRA